MATNSSQAPSTQPPTCTPASTAPLMGFGDAFKKPEGSWECDVCMVQNKAEDQQCVACQSAKPGAKVETKGSYNAAEMPFMYMFIYIYFIGCSLNLNYKYQQALAEEGRNSILNIFLSTVYRH